MLPLDLKIDKEGLLYTDDASDLLNRLLPLDNRGDVKNEYYASYFFRIPYNDDYIIKQPITLLNKKQREQYIELLHQLIEKQGLIMNTDFPVGYFKLFRKLAGLIVKYYKDGISLDNIVKEKDINLIGKYYSRDEDNIRNLLLLLDEILDSLYEMFENGIYYTDIITSNFVINENKVKIVDFDPVYVRFTDKDKNLSNILRIYLKMVQSLLNSYELPNEYSDNVANFKEAKTFLKKLDNSIRRGR